MKVRILASDSMGVRSMATYIETRDVKIFIDPGVALAPRRYGLPPHPIEIDERDRVWSEIVSYADKSDIIIVTHYHFDHFNPNDALDNVYGGKRVYLKDPDNNINPSQIRRSHLLLHRFEELELSPEIYVADDSEMYVGDTYIAFSKPFPHGHDSRLGYVIMVYVSDGDEGFIFSSDVEGPYSDDAVEFIGRFKPDTLFLDGPMTYLVGMRLDEEVIDTGLLNIARIIVDYGVGNIILDHHFMRDINYVSWLDKLFINLGEFSNVRGFRILTAAEYMERDIKLLEAIRDQLYRDYPPR
jgi:hypothetical protein